MGDVKDEFVSVPRHILRILGDREYLHDQVDANIRAGMQSADAYNEVQAQIHYYIPGFQLFKSSRSYWTCRNRDYKLRKQKKGPPK